MPTRRAVRFIMIGGCVLGNLFLAVACVSILYRFGFSGDWEICFLGLLLSIANLAYIFSSIQICCSRNPRTIILKRRLLLAFLFLGSSAGNMYLAVSISVGLAYTMYWPESGRGISGLGFYLVFATALVSSIYILNDFMAVCFDSFVRARTASETIVEHKDDSSRTGAFSMTRKRSFLAVVNLLYVVVIGVLLWIFITRSLISEYVHIKELTRQLTSGDDLEQAGAARYFGELRYKDAVPFLALALDDTHPLVRALSAMSLGKIGEAARPAKRALERRLNDDEEIVRVTATCALQDIEQLRDNHRTEIAVLTLLASMSIMWENKNNGEEIQWAFYTKELNVYNNLPNNKPPGDAGQSEHLEKNRSSEKEYKESVFCTNALKIRLLSPCQVVFENQAPSLAIEFENVSEKQIDLNEMQSKERISIGFWRDATLSSEPVDRYCISIYYKPPISAPVPFSPPETPEEKEKINEFDLPKKILLDPFRTIRVSSLMDPLWSWRDREDFYKVRLIFGNKVSNYVNVRVIKQKLHFKPDCPEQVKDLFRDVSSKPILEGNVLDKNSSFVMLKGTYEGTEIDWNKNRPYFALPESAKQICRDNRKHILDVLECNIGNYRIRYELFAFALEIEAFDLIPTLIDIISGHRNNFPLFHRLETFWMLGTLERLIGKKCGHYPRTQQRTGLHGLWWNYLRQRNE